MASTQASSAIDKDAIRRKYAAERDKRLRTDGASQYRRLESEFSDLASDPYNPVIERDGVTDHVTFAFIGGGFAGLVVGARLKEAGIDDYRIIEKGGDFGTASYATLLSLADSMEPRARQVRYQAFWADLFPEDRFAIYALAFG